MKGKKLIQKLKSWFSRKKADDKNSLSDSEIEKIRQIIAESEDSEGLFSETEIAACAQKVQEIFEKIPDEEMLIADPEKTLEFPQICTPEQDNQSGMPIKLIGEDSGMPDFDSSVQEHLMNTQYVYECEALPVDIKSVGSSYKFPFRFKETDCMMSFREKTPVFVADKATNPNVIFRHPNTYCRQKTDPVEFPCECVCILDDETLKLFEPFKSLHEKTKAVFAFARLTPAQRDHVRKQASKPKLRDGKALKKGYFMPIMDVGALSMTYKMCRETYTPEMRARIDMLMDRLDHPTSPEGRTDIITQLSYALCIDTAPQKRKNKSYDEIMAVLNKHVYGMQDLKERIAEYILSMQYANVNFFNILLVGSPGVGKTTFCEAVSEVLECEIANVDCSGVDFLGLCGLVKSYSGAQPSKISMAIVEKGKTDVLLRLDEIDKLVTNREGNAFAALTKPLGPQRLFHDEFLAYDIDLSNSKIICTANSTDNIPGFILNRFGNNIFYMPDYGVSEKVDIALNYIIPKKYKEFNVRPDELLFTEDAVITIAGEYVADKGAREITGYIETLFRKAIKGWSRGTEGKPLEIDRDFVYRNLSRHGAQNKKAIGFGH